MARKVNVTRQFIRPFKTGRSDLSLRINEYTNTELFVNNATKQSKIPSQEKIELFDGPVLLPPEELVEACHAFIGSGDKSLPLDNVAYTDNGDAAVVLGASHTEDVSPPGACAAQRACLVCCQAQCRLNPVTPRQAHWTGGVLCFDIQTDAFVLPGADVDGDDVSGSVLHKCFTSDLWKPPQVLNMKLSRIRPLRIPSHHLHISFIQPSYLVEGK